jgi:hypothetical protein
MAVVQHAISEAEVDQLFAGLQNALPHHFDNGAAAVTATVFRCSRRLRPLQRHLRDLPKREPALPERWVTGLASYGIDRRSARRKCAGNVPDIPSIKTNKQPYSSCLRGRVLRQVENPSPPWQIGATSGLHRGSPPSESGGSRKALFYWVFRIPAKSGGEGGTPFPHAAIELKSPKNKDSKKDRSSFVTTAVYH